MTDVPLLRAPPFPGRSALVARAAGGSTPLPEAIFAQICSARVGGAFWAAPAELVRAPAAVLRPRRAAEIETLAAEHGGPGALWVA
ncbi:MAG: beta-3-deoxy-D-manno-oct-2-ulosonic acid transferase, partial [Novosphingobium sp.]|nr:beta-3-deoxy-D-manno-oct-2-ulosonic acid transferase [Novosphingobium sp.]